MDDFDLRTRLIGHCVQYASSFININDERIVLTGEHSPRWVKKLP